MNKKHGLPGIGITAPSGKKGKSGNGFYFGPLDSFFTYIGDDILDNMQIDYEDIDFDLTYVQDEERLDPKYKVGDILYITDTIIDGTDEKRPIQYMVEITDDLTTCRKSYFVQHIKEMRPFTIKSSYDEHTYMYPITIVDTSSYGYNSYINDEKESNFHNLNEFIYNSKLSICNYDGSNNIIDISIITNDTSIVDTSMVMDSYTYNYIPYTYFSDNYKRQDIVNDGRYIYKYTYENIDVSTNLISMNACKSTYMPGDVDNELLIYSQRDKALIFSTLGRNKLFFDNLYIRNDNIGNVDAYYTLYDSNIALDNDGNCYTLTSDDYNASIIGFVIDPQKFLNDEKLDISSFNYGYIHMYWNCDDYSINASTQKNNYYKPNYIRGEFMSEEPLTLYIIKCDEYGNYIRKWDDDAFKQITNTDIRDLLINTTSNKTLYDVSNKLWNNAQNDPEVIKFKDVSGLIQIEYITDYRPYNKIQTIDTGVEYRDYGEDTYLYIDLSINSETVRREYHDVLYCPSTVINTIITIDPETGEEVEEEYEEIVLNACYGPEKSFIQKYIDVSYYSCIDNYINPSINMIYLNTLDPQGLSYKHHEIIQWVSNPSGLKYYSKKTTATYDIQTNQYIIEGEWENTNNLTEYQKTKDSFPEPVFHIQLMDNKMYLDASNKGQQSYIIDCSSTILENSLEIDMLDSSDLIRQYVYESNIQLDSSTFDNVIGSDDDLQLLDKLAADIQVDYNINNEYVIYQIPYYITDANHQLYEKMYISKVQINNFDDYRTLPVVNLRGYNELELLQNVNNIDYGVMCNQFQYFIDVDVDKFTYEDWGKMSYVSNPTLKLGFTLDLNIYSAIDMPLNNSLKGVSIAMVKPGLDVTKTSQKELCKNENLVLITDLSNTENYFIYEINDSVNNSSTFEENITFTKEFTLDEIYDGTYRIWILLEAINPVPLYMYMHAYISSLEINAENTSQNALNSELTYSLSASYLYNINTNTYRYETEPLKAVIAPISYIAGYNQQMEDIIVINNKLQGNDSPISISIKPYLLDIVESLYTGYTDRQKYSYIRNWNGLKFKKRFLQDHIKHLSISTLNINTLCDSIDETYPFNHYKTSYMVQDPDDIFDTYLQLVYNADLYKSRLIEDQEQFIYNGQLYLSSKYDQYNNNTAVFIKQESDYELRSNSLLNSMKQWNETYPSIKYESDNPYLGHISVFGNGYQYIPKSYDQGQYTQFGFMSLSDVKQLNNRFFFDNDVMQDYTQDINKAGKNNPYTPTELFRSLLYQMKWVYPYYYSQDGLNYIHQLPITQSNINPSDNEMPYNLTYDIYPRIMFNDEEQIIMILMLRCPSIIEEGQYELNSDDIYIPDTDTPGQLTDPINVLD